MTATAIDEVRGEVGHATADAGGTDRPGCAPTATADYRRSSDEVIGLTPTAEQKLYDAFAQGKTKRGQMMPVDSARITLRAGQRRRSLFTYLAGRG